MVAGSLSETCVYTGKPESKEAVQEEFSKQFQPFIDNDVDFVVAEVFCICLCFVEQELRR